MTGIELALVVVAVACAGVAVLAVTRREGGRGTADGMAEAQAAELRRLADAVGRQALDDRGLREDLARTRGAVDELRVRDEERRARDEVAQGAVRRLEAAFLGASSRGRVGENVVWEALSVLPPDMVDTGFRVNGKLVEFCLRLPNGQRLPVDSKWAAVAELEALESAEGPERQRLAGSIERIVAERAKEVAKYLDGGLTTPFAVAAVPDAVHAVLRKAHLDAYGHGVLLVPYSSALSILLALYSLCCRLGTDHADVGAALAEVGAALDAIERTLENSIERAAKTAQNGAAEIRAQVGKGRGALARTRAQSDEPANDVPGPGGLRALG